MSRDGRTDKDRPLGPLHLRQQAAIAPVETPKPVDSPSIEPLAPPNKACSSEVHPADDEALVSPPTGWPGSFKTNAALKAFLLSLKAKRVRVVGLPSAADVQEAAATATAAGHSLNGTDAGNFARAARIQHLLKWPIVAGFALYECPDSHSFVAFERWWNAKPSGPWVDFSHRHRQPSGSALELVLLESPLCRNPNTAFAAILAAAAAQEAVPAAATTASAAPETAAPAAAAPAAAAPAVTSSTPPTKLSKDGGAKAPRYARVVATRRAGFNDGFGAQLQRILGVYAPTTHACACACVLHAHGASGRERPRDACMRMCMCTACIWCLWA